MQLIEKIEISYFRGFKKTEIYDLKDLNIFSGSNDSGKSNILRALNLFFNGEISPGVPLDMNRDFNYLRDQEISTQTKGKKSIDITVYFFAKSTTKLRNARFSIKKRWNFEGIHSTTVFKDENWSAEIYNIYREPNIYSKDTTKDDASERSKSVNRFLNTIFFYYVPAIKDDNFFSHIFGKLLSNIKENEIFLEKKKISNNIQGLEFSINSETKVILDQFNGISLRFNVPKNLETFFSAFDIGTTDINSELLSPITIKSRGDGIQAKLIPYLLELLEINQNKKTKNKNLFIWGFEEPENSFEYKNAHELANRFKDTYSSDKNRQIFLTTHSFNFLSLTGPNLAKFRIFRGIDNISEVIGPIGTEYVKKQTILLRDENLEKLEEELGVFTLNNELEKIYLEKQAERDRYFELNTQIERQLSSNTKNKILLVEGEIEKDVFKKIFGDTIDFEIIWPGSGADNLANYLISRSYIKDNKIILGLFDKDDAGKNGGCKFEKNKGPFYQNVKKEYIIPNNSLKNVLNILKIPFSFDELMPDFVWQYLNQNDFLEDATKFDINIIPRDKNYNQYLDEIFSGNDVFKLKVSKKIKEVKKSEFHDYILSLSDSDFDLVKNALQGTISKILDYFNN